MNRHPRECGCVLCTRLEERVETLEAWSARHRPHLRENAIGTPLDFARETYPHPDGNWFWLVCPCGHRFLTIDRNIDEAGR